LSELDFSGRNVLVVGGSSGIGNGIAQAFREKAAQVYVWGTRGSAQDYSDEPGSNMTGLRYAKVDVANAGELDAWQPPFDRLDILVLSQGTVLYRRAEFELANFRKVVEINLTSVMACAMKFYEMLKSAQGTLIVISSDAAFHSTRGNPAYNSSKTGAVGLTRTLAEAWAGEGIRVNGIAPGLVPSKLTSISTSDPKRLQRYIDRIPLKRAGTPQDMAGVALFLASPLAAYVIGQTIQVDGGMLLA